MDLYDEAYGFDKYFFIFIFLRFFIVRKYYNILGKLSLKYCYITIYS